MAIAPTAKPSRVEVREQGLGPTQIWVPDVCFPAFRSEAPRLILNCPAFRPCHATFHGLMTSIPQPSKSDTLRVAREAPRDRAMAAIWASACEMGRSA